MNKRILINNYIAISLALLLLISCGGGGPSGPATAIPPSVVRPDQPEPIYTSSADTFNLTPTTFGTDVGLLDMALGDDGLDDYATDQRRNPIPALPNSALGITQAAATLLSHPYDPAVNSKAAVLQTLPGGSVVTVTGRAYDGRYLAVYTGTGIAGWLRLQDVVLYGGGEQGLNLSVVTQSTGPTALATALAEAMRPVPFSTIDVPTLQPTSATLNQPATRPQPSLNNSTIQPNYSNTTSGAMAEVLDVAYLDVYAEPDYSAAIIAQIDYGERVPLLSKNAVGDWVEVPIPTGSGWAPVAYLRVDASMDSLPIKR